MAKNNFQNEHPTSIPPQFGCKYSISDQKSHCYHCVYLKRTVVPNFSLLKNLAEENLGMSKKDDEFCFVYPFKLGKSPKKFVSRKSLRKWR